MYGVSVYSNTEIREAIKKGIIICEPHNPNYISEASLDFTLGYYYYQQEANSNSAIYNPFDEEEVNRYFKGPLKAKTHEQWSKESGFTLLKNIPPHHPVIVLKPGERILAHTHEFIGIRAEGGACEVKSRSSWGRNGVAVCFDAGWVDPGYINRITLEIYNLNKHESVVLPVGERIGQLIFQKTGPVEGSYSDGRGGISGKYQHTDNLVDLKKSWRPEMMLPRAYKDQRKAPVNIVGLLENIK